MTDAPVAAAPAVAAEPVAVAQPAPSLADTLYPAGGEGGGAVSGETTSGEESSPAPLEGAASGDATATAPADGGSTLTADSYTFTLPEGFAADDALGAEAKAAFLAAGVDPTKAQGLVDLFASAQQKAQATAQATFDTTQAQWATEINALPAFQGATKATSLQAIGALFDTYGADAREVFNDPSIGNNPKVVTFIHNLAQALKEGGPTAQGRPASNDGNGRPAKGRTAADILYPNSPSH